MPWHIFDACGRVIGITRYASDAARLATSSGPGATVRHRERVILVVTENTAAMGALCVADEMIRAAYDKWPRPT